MARKEKAQAIHARRRAMERYGINLGPNLHAAWVRQIQDGLARFISKETKRCTIFEIEHEGERVRVLYDKRTKQVVTIFPKDDPRWGGRDKVAV